MKIEQLAQADLMGTPQRREDALSEQLRFWRRSIAKHKLAVLFLTALVGVITAFVVFSITPIYRATTTVFIEQSKSKVVSIDEVYSGISANREHIQTQAEIIKSRELAAKLVKRLDLVAAPALDPRQRPPSLNLGFEWRDLAPAAWLPQEPLQSDEAVTNAVIRAVQSDLDVQLVRNSQLIRVSFESSDRELAARVANSISELYIESDMEARLQMTQKAAMWLNGRIKGLRENLETSERALQQFRDKEKIVDAKGVALGASRQLDDLTTSMVNARQKASELENAYNQVQAVLKGQSRATLETIPAVLRNATVAKFKELEGEAERRRAEQSKRYGAEHPRMIAAESDLKSARENTKRAIDTVVESITREYEVAKATEQSFAITLERSKSEIQNIGRKEFQLAALERDVQTNRQLYDMFMGRFKETAAAGDLQSTIARIIDPAVVLTTPVKPQKGLIISIALVVGLMLGVMLAFLLEYLDNTVRTSDDVETKLQAPLLGVLQWIRAKHKTFELQRAYLDNALPAFTEAVRTLRTGILMSALDNPHKVVLVTSSLPDEGKTSVACNLAFALAQVKRTCLIDADMRRPQLAKILGMDTSVPGLSHLVAGTEPAAKCIHEYENSGLFVIPSGAVPPNPLELLSSKRFGEAMKKLEESFDVIIIDSPPIQLVSDALILAGTANAVVFVVRADSTPYQVARGGIELLGKGKAHLLGVVINQLDLEKAERYYGYGKYFSYGYKHKYYKRYGNYGGANK
jgi:succinoglycan biosynthesis transport protein ExoP